MAAVTSALPALRGIEGRRLTYRRINEAQA
jgi:hypothetical protein